MSFIMAALATLAACSSGVFSATVTIDNTTGLQNAINAAGPGDIIIANPGIYYENIDFGGKAVTIRSTNPASSAVVNATVIDGGGIGSTVVFVSNEGTGSVLEGFTITNGNAVYGGGIRCGNADAGQCAPVIRYNMIMGNKATTGGGIYCDSALNLGNAPTITCNAIIGNSADYGGGVAWNKSSPLLLNNTISGNKAKYAGGGIRTGLAGTGMPLVKNSILSNNTAFPGPDIWLGDPAGSSPASARLTVSYSDVLGGISRVHVDTGSALTYETTNIDADPLYASPGTWAGNVWNYSGQDYHVQSQAGRWNPAGSAWVLDASTSSCIDKGDPASNYANEPAPNGGRINLGAYGNTVEASKTYTPASTTPTPTLTPTPTPIPTPTSTPVLTPTPTPVPVTLVRISGYVTTGGSGMAGVTLLATNGGSSTSTSADGYYELTVSSTWSGTVAASKQGWTFEPAGRTYSSPGVNQSDQNFIGTSTGSAPQVKISGYVLTGGGAGIEGATVSGTNGGGSYTTTAGGYYEVFVPANWTGEIVLSKIGWSFSPEKRSYTALGADQSGQNFSGTSLVSRIEISGPDEVNENTSAQYACTVFLSDGTSGDATALVTWSVPGATAAGIDSAGKLTAGEVSGDQTITLQAAYSGSNVQKTITIRDAGGDQPSPTETPDPPTGGGGMCGSAGPVLMALILAAFLTLVGREY
jgi:hypothetical protein